VGGISKADAGSHALFGGLSGNFIVKLPGNGIRRPVNERKQ
jgi:hypothetical protein